LQKTRQQLADIGVSSDPAAARMYFLTSKVSEKDVHAMQKLMPRQHFVEQWRNLEDDAKELAKQLTAKEYAAPSATWTLLMSTRPELIIFLDITTRQSAVEQKIKAFLTKWPQYRQKMPLLKMTEMRITPELPVYQQLLDEMFLMMLDGKLRSEAEIVKFLEPHQPPLPVAPPSPARRGRGKKKVAKAAQPAPPAPEGAAAASPQPAATPQPGKSGKAETKAPVAVASKKAEAAAPARQAAAGKTAPQPAAKKLEEKKKPRGKPAAKPKPKAKPAPKKKTGKKSKR
jgi:tRNA nucleotidyltransferase (CCA-adding enzyme)